MDLEPGSGRPEKKGRFGQREEGGIWEDRKGGLGAAGFPVPTSLVLSHGVCASTIYYWGVAAAWL